MSALPTEGLFADKAWHFSPGAFPLDEKLVEDLEKLGHRLAKFNRACNLLYHQSVKGKQPAWIADYLDRGKPADLVALGRHQPFREDLPEVIRPDVILTEEGFTLAELDSVPGGIGLTAWLGGLYAGFGEPIVGGAEGMIGGFREIFPGGTILVSPESATYRPEMQWLADRLNARFGPLQQWQVRDTDAWETVKGGPQRVYRFFELFDLPNLGAAPALIADATAGRVAITPPPKAFLEEKMWFALFWMRPLREFWRRELGERHWLALRHCIPQTWILDPAPLPHHAVIPGLEIQRWEELGDLSQKERGLILKISGYSEFAWGSRGVVMAADVPRDEWRTRIAKALGEFDSHPHILQRFHKGRLVRHPYFDHATGGVRTMEGRVRLCPYYFCANEKTRLGGVLATICPADKKLLHGMSDAILVPCAKGGTPAVPVGIAPGEFMKERVADSHSRE